MKEIIISLSNEESSYIAGFLDADGTISTTNKGKSFSPNIVVTNTDIELLKWIRGKVGFGNIYKRTIYSKKHRQSYNYNINSIPVVKSFLENIIPFLRIKNEQAKFLHKFCSLRMKNTRNNGYNSSLTEREKEIPSMIKEINKKKGTRWFGYENND